MDSVEKSAHALAARMPDLMIEARRVANTVAHGVHGRRRAGPGETFWQFRQVQSGDSAHTIDWRRSAASDTIYVREREWESAHTMWLWPDLSPSMDFKSHLSRTTKSERALVLLFALSDLLISGGERAGLMGLMPATASRRSIERMAQIIVEAQMARDKPTLGSPGDGVRSSLPPKTTLSRFNGLVLFGDFLDPIDDIKARLEAIAANGIIGHVVQILDPAEEALPYDGRVEFIDAEDGERIVLNRSEASREGYRQRIAAHKVSLAALAQRLQWSYLVHHTDRPAEEALLALHARLSTGRGQTAFPVAGAPATGGGWS